MSLPEKELGIISVLLKRLETERLPEILSLKKKVEAGETLGDADVEYLQRTLEEISSHHLGPLLERHPEYLDLAAAVFSAYRSITERDLQNEKRAHSQKPIARILLSDLVDNEAKSDG